MEAAPSDAGGEPKDPRWARALIAATLGISAVTFALVLITPYDSAQEYAIFKHLFVRDEPTAMWLATAIALLSVAAASFRLPSGAGIIASLTKDPRWFIAAMTVLLAASAVLVYRAYPISMDESAPLFQAEIFARGKLTGQFPPSMLKLLLPKTSPWFILASPQGQVVSAYWPGLALLLTPFVWLHCPWLLNPLIGGASLYFLWVLARRLWPGTTAPGWAVLLAAASPAFVVDAISFYSMSAHLLASMLFALLLLEPSPKRLFFAGVLGSFALVLHNPLPHALFALPWIAWLALQPGRGKKLFFLGIGYLALALFLGLGWVRVTAALNPSQATAAPDLPHRMAALWKLAFAAPGSDLLTTRAMNLSQLALWAVPFLLPLAVIAAARTFRELFPRLLALSALLTLGAYFFVPYDQGNGWGYRYFHAAWFTLPLFAAALLAEPGQRWIRRVMMPAALASLLLCNGLRFQQVRSFIDKRLARIPSPPNPNGEAEVVFVREDVGFFSVDMVQNDPFLRGRRWMLIGSSPRREAEVMHDLLHGGHLVEQNQVASVWRIDRFPELDR